MNCPRCNVELKESSTKEASIVYDAHSCPKCNGFWVGAEQLEEIQAKVKQRFFEFRRIPSASEQENVLHCPACAGSVEMDKVANERDAKVVMDVCPQCHNIWLDGGELEAIQRDSLLTLVVDAYRWDRKADS